MAAPILPATLTIEFGADDQEDGGAYALSYHNTGGLINGGAGVNALSGTNNSHFQIDSEGKISVSNTGRGTGTTLLATGTYSLNATVYSADGSDVVAITINIAANTQYIGPQVASGTGALRPTPATQLLNAMSTATVAGTSTGYGNATTTKTIKYRRFTEITPYSRDWFRSSQKTNTAVITHTAEDSSAPPVFRCITTANKVMGVGGAGATTREFSIKNCRFEYIYFDFPFYRTSNASVAAAMSSGFDGNVSFLGCTFASTTWDLMGPGEGYKGIWTTHAVGSTISFDSCTFTGYWYRCFNIDLPVPPALPAASLTIKNCTIQGCFGDGIQVNYTANTTLIENNTLQNFKNDTYNIGFSAIANISAASLTNQADAKKCLIALQIGNIGASSRILDYGGTAAAPGISVWTDASKRLVVTVRNTSGAIIYTLTGTTTYSAVSTAYQGYNRKSVLISIDTTGTSRIAVRHEGDLGAYTWVDEATNATAPNVNIDLTGPVKIGGTTAMQASWFSVWQNQAADVSNQTIRDTFFDSTLWGLATAAKRTGLWVTYGTPILDLFGNEVSWGYGTTTAPNNGSGGNLTKTNGTTGPIESAHADGIQFAPNRNVSDITIRGNKINPRSDDQSQNYRFDYTGIQPLFMEDIGAANHYTNVLIEYNLAIGAQPSGFALYNPVNCTIQYNTVLRDPNFGTYDTPIGLYSHSGGTGSGNVIRNNICSGAIAIPTGWGSQSNNVESSNSLVTGTLAWSNMFRGSAPWSSLTVDDAVNNFARKPGGYLALNDIGANFPATVAGSPPECTVPPVLTPGNNNYVGATLTLSSLGTWVNSPTSYDAQMQKGGVDSGAPIVGVAVGQQFSTISGAADYTVVVTGHNVDGSGTGTTNSITITAAPTYVANNGQLDLVYAGSSSIDMLTISQNLTDVTDVTGGNAYVSAVLNADNTITVTALPGFYGSVDFTVTMTGNSGAVTRTATLTVTVESTKTLAITTS